jgi:type IV pilus assembly protein PilX
MKTFQHPGKQQGAALVIGLILLVVITVLAISGMNTATTELAMARNDQSYEWAFQAAETGLENVLAQGQYTAVVGAPSPPLVVNINTNDSVSAVIEYEDSTLVPDRAFSLGVGSGISAYHFLATATAKSQRAAGGTDRDSSAIHTQAFYVVGPEAPTL